MSRSQESGKKRIEGWRPPVGAGEPSALADLGKRFARFREEHRRGARIPDDLRAAALALLREVAPSDVYRACGISFGQVVAWKEALARSPKAADARVFSVVDEEPVRRLASKPSASVTTPALELRIGLWSVSVRQVGTAGEGE